MSTVDQVESKVKLSKGQKKKKSAQKKKAAQKTAVEEEHRQRLEDDERKIDQQDAVLLDRYCDYTLKTQYVADDNDNYKSSYFDRVTRNRLNMLRASYKSRIRMATLVPIEFGAIENPLYMGIASKYIPPLKEDELEKETGPVVLKETLTTDDLDREHINTNWAFTKESFGVALAIWYPIFMECFLRGDKLSCAALRDTSMQLRACWNVFRGDITRLDQFVFDARNPTCIKQLNWVARRIELPVSPPSSPPSPDAGQQLGPDTSQRTTAEHTLPLDQSQEHPSYQEPHPPSAISSHMPLLEDVDSIFTSPLEQPDSLPLTPAHDPGSFGHYRSTRRWADYSDDESLGSPMSLPSRKIPTDIDVKVEDPEGIEEGNSLRMSEMERQEDDQDVDHFHLDESSVGHDLPLRPPPQCPPPQPQMKGVSLIQPDINGSSCALPSHLDDHLHHQPIESHHEPQQIPHSTPSHQVMKLLIAQPTLSLVTYTREENKTVLASTQLNVMSWEDYPAPKISTVERSMKLVSSTRKSFVVPVVKSDSQGGTSLSSTQNDSLSKSETEAQSSAQASSGKKSKKRSKKSTNAGPSNEPQKRKVEGLVETWLRYDKEKQSTAAATRRRTLKSTSASLLFSEPLQTLEESRQMEDDRDVWNDRLSMYYVQKFCTYIGSVDLLVGGIQVKEVAKMVFGGRFQTSKNALVPRAPPSVSCFQKGLGLGLSMDLGIESNDVGNEEDDDDDEKCWSMHWSTDENRVKVVLVEIPGEDTWWPRSIKDFATP